MTVNKKMSFIMFVSPSCFLSGMKSVQTYDPLHRNPLFCGADHSTLWELQKVKKKSVLINTKFATRACVHKLLCIT